MDKTKLEVLLNKMLDFAIENVGLTDDDKKQNLATQYSTYIAQARTLDLQEKELDYKDAQTKYAIDTQIKHMQKNN